MLREHTFGAEAFIYIRDQLSSGKTLSNLLLNLPLNEGKVIAFLSESFPSDWFNKFQSGIGMKASPSHKHLASFMSEYLRKSQTNLVIFEEPLKRSSDRHLSSRVKQYMTHDSEVYPFLTSREAGNLKQINSFIADSTAYYFLAALTASTDRKFDNRQDVTRDVLMNLALATKYIIVGAYDGEGHLIWSQ
jgi:hypothetical protein